MLIARKDRALILGAVRVIDAPRGTLVAVDAAIFCQTCARAIARVARAVTIAWVGVTEVVNALTLFITGESLCAGTARPAAAIIATTLPVTVGLATTLLDNVRAARPQYITTRLTGAPARGDTAAVVLTGGIRRRCPAVSCLTDLTIRAHPALAATTVWTARLSIASWLALRAADAIIAEELSFLRALAAEPSATIQTALASIALRDALGACAIGVAGVAATSDHGIGLDLAVGVRDATSAVALDAIAKRRDRTCPLGGFEASFTDVVAGAGREQQITPAHLRAGVAIRVRDATLAITDRPILVERAITGPICRDASPGADAALLAIAALSAASPATIRAARALSARRRALGHAGACHTIRRGFILACAAASPAAIVATFGVITDGGAQEVRGHALAALREGLIAAP